MAFALRLCCATRVSTGQRNTPRGSSLPRPLPVFIKESHCALHCTVGIETQLITVRWVPHVSVSHPERWQYHKPQLRLHRKPHCIVLYCTLQRFGVEGQSKRYSMLLPVSPRKKATCTDDTDPQNNARVCGARRRKQALGLLDTPALSLSRVQAGWATINRSPRNRKRLSHWAPDKT
jgi:hypothetical protein